MTTTNRDNDAAPRAVVPADVEAPDRVVWGLTFRQLAILTAAAVAGWGVYRTVGHLMPPVVLIGAAVPLAGVVAVVALGRRDGLPLDVWLLAAIGYRRAPRRQAPPPTDIPAPPPPDTATLAAVPAVLRLPVDAISDTGHLTIDGGRAAAVVACGTVNLHLRTGAEQAALLDGLGRWLNSLSAPVQIVVSAQRVDLDAYATAVADTAVTLPHPALQTAAGDYIDFLHQLADTRDPLRRTVLVVTHSSDATSVTRNGEDTARALARLGVTARLLDGPAVTAAVTAAVDPYQPPPAGPRAVPDTVITSTRTADASAGHDTTRSGTP